MFTAVCLRTLICLLLAANVRLRGRICLPLPAEVRDEVRLCRVRRHPLFSELLPSALNLLRLRRLSALALHRILALAHDSVCDLAKIS